MEDQPNIPAGEVSLYRGIGQAARFRGLRFRLEELSPANAEIWRKHLHVQADILSESILVDGTWVGDELATQAGLDIQSPGTFGRPAVVFARTVMGVGKFGPHHIIIKTPLSNIRITTFFAAESEAKIVDPSRISEVHAVGCQVDFASPME